MTEKSPDDRQWHLDKRVPLALIITIVVQTIGVSWWAATTSIRLEMVERKMDAAAPQAERLIRLDEKVGVIQQSVNEIRTELKARPR